MNVFRNIILYSFSLFVFLFLKGKKKIREYQMMTLSIFWFVFCLSYVKGNWSEFCVKRM